MTLNDEQLPRTVYVSPGHPVSASTRGGILRTFLSPDEARRLCCLAKAGAHAVLRWNLLSGAEWESHHFCRGPSNTRASYPPAMVRSPHSPRSLSSGCLCTASSGCRPCWFMLTVLLFGGIFPSKYRVAFLSNFVFFKEGFPNCLGFSKGAKHLCCLGDVTLASAQHTLLPWCPGPTCLTDVLDNTCSRVYSLHPTSGFIPIASYVVHGFIAMTTL